MPKKALNFVVALFSVLMVGCVVSLTPAKDVPERLAYAYAAAAAVANTTVYMYKTGKISKQQGYVIYTKLEAVDKYLTMAKDFLDKGLPTDAAKQIDLAMYILEKLEAELKEKEGTKVSMELVYV